jgi:predicted HicB family RNase H-like nuclease
MIKPTQLTEVKRTTEHLYAQRPDWATFYRETLGLRGVVRRTFPSREARAAFEQTDAYREILQRLTELRQQGPAETVELEPIRVITVRLPKSMHDALRAEAHEYQTSMNQLCISKLLQFIDNGRVPSDV